MRNTVSVLTSLLLLLSFIIPPTTASTDISLSGTFSLDIPVQSMKYMDLHLKVKWNLYTDNDCNIHVDIDLSGTKAWEKILITGDTSLQEPENKQISFTLTPFQAEYLYGDTFKYNILHAFPFHPARFIDEENLKSMGILDALGFSDVYFIINMPSIPVKDQQSMCQLAQNITQDNIYIKANTFVLQSNYDIDKIIPFDNTHIRGLQVLVTYLLTNKGNKAYISNIWEIPYGKIVMEGKSKEGDFRLIKMETSFLRLNPNISIVPHSAVTSPWGDLETSLPVYQPIFPIGHPFVIDSNNAVIPMGTVKANPWQVSWKTHLQFTGSYSHTEEYTFNSRLPLFTAESVNNFIDYILMHPDKRGPIAVKHENNYIKTAYSHITSIDIVNAAKEVESDYNDYAQSKPYLYMLKPIVPGGSYTVGIYLDKLPVPYHQSTYQDGSPYLMEQYPAGYVGIVGNIKMATDWETYNITSNVMNSNNPLNKQAELIKQSLDKSGIYLGFSGLLWKHISPEVISLLLFNQDKLFSGFDAPLKDGYTPIGPNISVKKQWLANYIYHHLEKEGEISNIPGTSLLIITPNGSFGYSGIHMGSSVKYDISGGDKPEIVAKVLNLDYIQQGANIIISLPNGQTHTFNKDEIISISTLGYQKIYYDKDITIYSLVSDNNPIFTNGISLNLKGNKLYINKAPNNAHLWIYQTGQLIKTADINTPYVELPYGEITIKIGTEEQYASTFNLNILPPINIPKPQLNPLPLFYYEDTISVVALSSTTTIGDMYIYVNSTKYQAKYTTNNIYKVNVKLIPGDNEIKAKLCLNINGSIVCSDYSDSYVITFKDQDPPAPLITTATTETYNSSINITVKPQAEWVKLFILNNKDVIHSATVPIGMPPTTLNVNLQTGSNTISAYVETLNTHRKSDINTITIIRKEDKYHITPVHLELWLGKPYYIKNGVKLLLDVAPFVVPPGRTVVPLRVISEALGFKVKWDNTNREAIISGINSKGCQVEVHFSFDKEASEGWQKAYDKKVFAGSPYIKVFATPISTQASCNIPSIINLHNFGGVDYGTPIISKGRTFVPLRIISELMGATVSWDGKERKITIDYSN